MNFPTLLIVLPLLFAPFTLVPNLNVRNILSIFFIVVLSGLSILNIVQYESEIRLSVGHSFHLLFFAIDTLLLLFFLLKGILFKHKLVTLFALAQIVLYGAVVFLSPEINGDEIVVDQLSGLMYLVINIVGGIIIIYALKYIESEEFSRMKKNSFIAILFLFLAVMNFIVSTNSIEIFFLLFELTTLCSYILIGYRGNEISVKNALQALWMNQVGGVAILVALLFSISQYNTIYFDQLLKQIDMNYLLPVVLLVMAAFVKGASIPFDRWLLGAMIAPTPVSAILHSATMVKIAPYLILKLAPAMSGFVSVSVTLFGTFVFFAASLFALSKDSFKEILGYSTVALLALMMALAAIGTDEAKTAAVAILVFHAISKAMLFLQAGILEKELHLKYVDDINGLINTSPLVVFFILIGFASLTLPPFGAFIGKFIAIESLSSLITQNPLYVFALVFLLLGSVLLTLLYFKVATKLFAQDVDAVQEPITISKFYSLTSALLLLLLLAGVYFCYNQGVLGSVEILIASVVIALVPLSFATLLFKNAHRVKEYNCGEKDAIKLGMYYFSLPQRVHSAIIVLSLAAMGIIVLGAAL